MIVYSDRKLIRATRQSLKDIALLDDPVARLIAYGEWEAGVTDAICPEQDEITPFTQSMRELSLTQAQGDPDFLLSFDLPSEIQIGVPEGFAFYGLFPQQYVEAAREFSSETASGHCWVIGIRSIGASLSGIVGAELRKAGWTVESFTVRPHGHPFDRFVSFHHELETVIRNSSDSWFLIVDEGPGISGSSFASVATKLSKLGVAEDRVVFFPSWKADPAALRSEKARQCWPRHRQLVTPFREEWIFRNEANEATDISAGQWRQSANPAVQPQHERRKYLVNGNIWKFVGLGSHGKTKLARARTLSQAGFIPPVQGLEQGFLISQFVPGDPLVAGEIDNNLITRIADYLSFVKRQFTKPGSIPYTALVEMIKVNTGHQCPPNNPLIEEGELVAVDGRMLPHEWIRTSSGLLKTDALDHHNDHFFPGCQDIAWDLAGACIEFQMNPEECEHLLSTYLTLQSDHTLRQRLPFYTMAYAAYRLGYSILAEQVLTGTADGQRFHKLQTYYKAFFQKAVESTF